MLTLTLAFVAGLLGGAVAGLLVTKRRSTDQDGMAQEDLDPAVAGSLDALAQRWAAAHGQPAAAPLMARKLRLLYRLNRRRGRRQTW